MTTQSLRITTKSTEAEYLERLELWKRSEDAAQPMIEMYTEYTGDTYTEECIPQIVMDAAEAAEMDTQGFDPWAYDYWNLPLRMKTEVMERAQKNWIPSRGGQEDDHQWVNEGVAPELFRSVPEAQLILTMSGEQVAEEYNRRTEAQRQG